MISRRQVEQHDVASLLDELKPLLATREDVWLYRGQMSLTVDGYNHDPRELVDIPEVRSLLRAFELVWPYWAYFFNQVDDSIKILGSCVCGSAYPGGGAVEIDVDELRAFFDAWVRRIERALRQIRLSRTRTRNHEPWRYRGDRTGRNGLNRTRSVQRPAIVLFGRQQPHETALDFGHVRKFHQPKGAALLGRRLRFDR